MAAFLQWTIGLGPDEQSRGESRVEFDGLALHAIPAHIAASIRHERTRDGVRWKTGFTGLADAPRRIETQAGRTATA